MRVVVCVFGVLARLEANYNELAGKAAASSRQRSQAHARFASPKQLTSNEAEAKLYRYRWSVVEAARPFFDSYPSSLDDAGARRFFNMWQQSLRDHAVPHTAVFVPFPWRFVMEIEVRNRNVLHSFGRLLDWWNTLQFGKYRHFVVLQLCSMGAVKIAATLLGRAFVVPDDVRHAPCTRHAILQLTRHTHRHT